MSVRDEFNDKNIRVRNDNLLLLKAYRGLKLFILTCLIRGLNLKIIFIID
ncbi:hypothetical protein BAZSYMB_SCAFFOLD00004_25 [Bathymodiolus azoricus thioautotrophic gill symbiont]|uniref:Uncharacterized protein n=1 Tax=Bathymodiolus azoricus thioautotrophic gill symbiont TaxID=235205 RepID=A0A1H6J5R3_9GAMM|nr:hypothetical protein BAZSYMB_SCAFFOLD00004_25 [Bathymodiolus azoricus thioautotrophic gill symbiont]